MPALQPSEMAQRGGEKKFAVRLLNRNKGEQSEVERHHVQQRPFHRHAQHEIGSCHVYLVDCVVTEVGHDDVVFALVLTDEVHGGHDHFVVVLRVDVQCCVGKFFEKSP